MALGKHRNSPIFEIDFPKLGVKARATVINCKIVVLKGSDARRKWDGPKNAPAGRCYDKLRASGVLKPGSGRNFVFTQDHEFPNPSKAASVIAGNRTGGPKKWKLKSKVRNLKDWMKINCP